MKTRNLLIAISALALAGCSQNEITEMSPDANPAVGFSVYTGVQTRGVETTQTLLQGSPATTSGSTKGGGFGVLAYYTGQTGFPSDNSNNSYAPNFMYNQKVAWESTSPGAWKYSPLKYWPNTKGDKITFFAYGPYSAAANFPTSGEAAIDNGITLSGNTDQGYPKLTFTVKGTASSAAAGASTGTNSSANAMVDLVVATNKDEVRTTENIKFQFKHILSRANFQAKLDKNLTNSGQGAAGDGKTYVCVTGARIVGKNNNSDSKFYGKAVYQWVSDTWDYTESTSVKPESDYDLASVLSLVDRSSGSGQPFYNKNYSTDCVVLKQDGTATELFQRKDVDSKTTDEYLFLIPPTDNTNLTSSGGITSEKDVLVEIDYDVITFDDALSNGSSEKYSKTSTKATVSLPNGTLKRGKAYNFIFTIGLNEVKVDADVDTWGTEDEIVYAPSAAVASTFNAEGVAAAITALNSAKEKNPNCNYFVVTAPANTSISSATTIDLSSGSLSISTDKFEVGDRIEINLSNVSGIDGSKTFAVTAPSGWSASSAVSSNTSPVILTKVPAKAS
ncbi:fimbrillin family protein [Bacteroides sp. GD17]|jgi:hypothetical protein|uniref:fimbrillin family protein n=1 Tax=Bacteroides sp. GD17 TaxID=3139826 RepID=UPI0025F60A5C|nr:fimbrillin family protein [uncultured Bacteroides sp.]